MLEETGLGGAYDESMGVMLEHQLHKDYDAYKWAINPKVRFYNVYVCQVYKYIFRPTQFRLRRIHLIAS